MDASKHHYEEAKQSVGAYERAAVSYVTLGITTVASITAVAVESAIQQFNGHREPSDFGKTLAASVLAAACLTSVQAFLLMRSRAIIQRLARSNRDSLERVLEESEPDLWAPIRNSICDVVDKAVSHK